MGKVYGAIAAIVVVLGVIVLGMYFSTSNTEIALRTQAAAQQKKNEAIYDKVWKTIQQKAGIVDKYAGDFKAIFGTLMSERYQGETKGAPMFKWITEHNPNFSVDLYKDLSDAVESNRAEFVMVQSRLLDIKREHQNLLKQFPSCVFVGGRDTLKIQIVTSTKTEKTFAIGKEDSVTLFNK